MFSAAEVWDCHVTTYHADKTSISHSLAERYIENPELYAGIISGEIEQEETPPLRRGHLLHTEMEGSRLIFEPERYADLSDSLRSVDFDMVREYPSFCFKPGTTHLQPNTNKGRMAWERDTKEENPFCVFMKPDDARLLEEYTNWHRSIGNATICKNQAEYDQIKKMGERLRTHEKVKQLLSFKGEHEFTIRMVHTETGLPCRARLDWFSPPWILDWKTAASITDRGFARSAWTFGYHRQAAWYIDAARAYLGPDHDEHDNLTFVFAAVLSEKPYTPRCFTLDPVDFKGCGDPVLENITDWVELGRRQNAAVLRAIAAGRKAGGVYKSREWDSIISLSAPRFAKFDESFELPITD